MSLSNDFSENLISYRNMQTKKIQADYDTLRLMHEYHTSEAKRQRKGMSLFESAKVFRTPRKRERRRKRKSPEKRE